VLDATGKDTQSRCAPSGQGPARLAKGASPSYLAGCSKRPSSKAAASEEVRRTLQYVEPLSEARTPMAGFLSSLRARTLRPG